MPHFLHDGMQVQHQDDAKFPLTLHASRLTLMLKAIIFDFNGVIADDETPHVLTFQQALREHGLTLTKEEYYGRYLGMDERNCTEALLRTRKGRVEPAMLQAILERKADLFREYTATHKPRLFPGVVELVMEAGTRYRLAIASGGRREQIHDALRDTPIEKNFDVIVSAEDTKIGKPDPAMYQLALTQLNDSKGAIDAPYTPGECLVIEDSKAGIQSAKAAGMTVVAVATTYPAEQLAEADVVVPRLEGLKAEWLESVFRET